MDDIKVLSYESPLLLLTPTVYVTLHKALSLNLLPISQATGISASHETVFLIHAPEH